MLLGPNSFQVTTAILITGGCVVSYLRLRNNLESNLPLFFYAVMLIYANALDGRLSPWIVYTALLLGLVLRFEFMGPLLTRFVRYLELGALGVMIYSCTVIMLRW